MSLSESESRPKLRRCPVPGLAGCALVSFVTFWRSSSGSSSSRRTCSSHHVHSSSLFLLHSLVVVVSCPRPVSHISALLLLSENPLQGTPAGSRTHMCTASPSPSSSAPGTCPSLARSTLSLLQCATRIRVACTNLPRPEMMGYSTYNKPRP